MKKGPRKNRVCTRSVSTLCTRLLILARPPPGCQQAGPGGSGTRSGGLAARSETNSTYIRPTLHPVRRRCFSVKYCRYFPRRVLSDRRITGLGATRDFHDGPLVSRVRWFPEPLGPASAWPGTATARGTPVTVPCGWPPTSVHRRRNPRSPSAESVFNFSGIRTIPRKRQNTPRSDTLRQKRLAHFERGRRSV